MKSVYTILVDMDCILVDMLPAWLKIYNKISGERVKYQDIFSYDTATAVKNPDLLMKILHSKWFFLNLPPMPGAIKYFQALISKGYDLVIVTQPPRKVDYAFVDKRKWIHNHFPRYDLSNIVFCHRKNLVRGDLLFDDKPEHLIDWKKSNLKGMTATIEYPYNKNTKTDIRFKDRKTAWKEFYNFVISLGE